jgi:hypothetical protein
VRLTLNKIFFEFVASMPTASNGRLTVMRCNEKIAQAVTIAMNLASKFASLLIWLPVLSRNHAVELRF